jgi:hypothetical protein
MDPSVVNLPQLCSDASHASNRNRSSSVKTSGVANSHALSNLIPIDLRNLKFVWGRRQRVAIFLWVASLVHHHLAQKADAALVVIPLHYPRSHAMLMPGDPKCSPVIPPALCRSGRSALRLSRHDRSF